MLCLTSAKFSLSQLMGKRFGGVLKLEAIRELRQGKQRFNRYLVTG